MRKVGRIKVAKSLLDRVEDRIAIQQYISTKMPLERYQRKILQERKEQIQAIKDKVFRDKLIELADAAVGALSLIIPYTRIGELFVTTLSLTMANIAVRAAQGVQGNKEAVTAIFQEDIVGLLFEAEKLKMVMPGWVKFAFEAKEDASILYTSKDQEKEFAIPEQVPADSILDQIYRFRCIVDRTLPKQIESALNNNQPLMASILAWR